MTNLLNNLRLLDKYEIDPEYTPPTFGGQIDTDDEILVATKPKVAVQKASEVWAEEQERIDNE